MDVDQIAALYRSFSPELLAWLRRRFPWADDVVEDAVQHAFLQLQVTASPPDEPRAWLRTVARNFVLDRLTRDGKLVGNDELIDGLPAADATTTSSVSSISTTLVQRALLQLTTRAHRLLRGKYQEGKSYDTLAHEEGVAKSGMGRILDRARESLRRAIEELRRGR